MIRLTLLLLLVACDRPTTEAPATRPRIIDRVPPDPPPTDHPRGAESPPPRGTEAFTLYAGRLQVIDERITVVKAQVDGAGPRATPEARDRLTRIQGERDRLEREVRSGASSRDLREDFDRLEKDLDALAQNVRQQLGS